MKSLEQFIAECLEGTKIYEMARSLDKYKELVENMIQPIAAHVILILKSRQENDDEYIRHWKHELIKFLGKFFNIKLKTKDSYKKKLQHIEKVLLDEEEIDTDDRWFIANLWDKMYEEGYDLHDKKTWEEFLPIIHDFQDNHLPQIIDIIASQSMDKAYAYVDSL